MSVTETRGPLGGEWLTVADRMSVVCRQSAMHQISIVYILNKFFFWSQLINFQSTATYCKEDILILYSLPNVINDEE